ncbi:unnamed protein product [Rotaria sp. Silwood1]|nr:unnamed protein product [Rotaria sp. Silwood1]CAF0961933.1 unnamed protein product [Rotaria sp. Silwood1]
MTEPTLIKRTSQSSTSSRELCSFCSERPYDLICTCGDKFDFICIHSHVAEIRHEFENIHDQTGEQLLQVEHATENKDCTNAKTIIENWRQKRIQEINDIADDALNQTQHLENAYLNVGTFRTQYNALNEQSERIDHGQLHSIHSLQRQIVEKIDQLTNLPELIQDDRSLDTKLQSKLNPNTFNPDSTTHVTESVISALVVPLDTTTSTTTGQPPIATSTMSIEQPKELVNNDLVSSSTMETLGHDDFDVGETVNIERNNPKIIPVTHDNYAGTVCCHNNQLVYNDYNESTKNSRLIFIPDLEQPTTRQIIDWNDFDRTIGDGDKWVQDIVYSTILKGYLLLTSSNLYVLHDNTNQLEEFHDFPGRTMKRVTCNDTYIYLIAASSTMSQNGDEIIIINYDKEEKVCKTLPDITLHGRNDMSVTHVGEISDLAISTNGQIILAYRAKLRRQVRVCIFNVSDDGNKWTIVKQLLLNDCWNDNVSFTPRMEWCEKLHAFFLIEYITSHLIMLDEAGQVKGECRFVNAQNRRESPLNITISATDKLCLRYESSINVHQLLDDRL